MSDVEESNAEDNDDLESVPSPPPKELTKEDITGKLDDNSDPTVVIERYQNTAEILLQCVHQNNMRLYGDSQI